MKKIITLLVSVFFFFNILSLWINQTFAEEKEIKVRIYWHIYNEDKNNPIKDISVYVEKNDKVLWSWKTNKEWLYDLVIDNRSDYLNLCIESNSFTKLKNINYCVTISAFQKLWRVVDWIEIREVEYDFYTNSKWENLNQLYEDEITNESTEESFSEYEENIQIKREEEERRLAEEERLAELEKMKEKYKMVNNTEMTWPLEAMQIIGTVKSQSWTNFDYNRTYIIAMDHQGNILKEEKLNKYYDFNITVNPKENEIFLHPVNLKIENREYEKVNWENIYKFENEYRLITKEKNIINIELKEKQITKFDKILYIKEKFPFIGIIIIIALIFITSILVIKNRIRLKRNDY